MAFALSSMTVTSPDFGPDGPLHNRHTGEGADLSPALSWSGEPKGTQSFAVICHDPDAPQVKNGSYGFVHWVLYNLPTSTPHLDEGSDKGTHGTNDFGTSGYGGPMPPRGHGRHHYYFWVLALDRQLDLPAGLTLGELLEKVEPHLMGMNRLVGVYERG
ncbi:MAG: YbhB/YbcL family Raf kinase inhibitor-like protein [Marinobacter sp.]|nr:YbhB/YbcL family Raf kinase inhibitor-like protein [Marinobacter sp.]